MMFCRIFSPRLFLRKPDYQTTRSVSNWYSAVRRDLRKRQDENPQKPAHRSTYLDWNYNAELYSFGKRLGEEFDNDLLRQALTERSYAIKLEEEQKSVGLDVPVDISDNANMVIQGENIIRPFVLQYLRHILPLFPEEGIISLTDYLTSQEVLSNVSFHIGTSELILCVDFPTEKSTLTNVFKALIFALSESSGLERACIFIRDLLITQLAEQNINDLWPIEDPIAMLNNIVCTNEGYSQPEPRIIGDAGVNTIMACYRIGLYVNKQLIGSGFGETVAIAHEMAATDTLRRLFGTTESQLVLRYDIVLEPQLENQIPNVSVNDWSQKKVKEHLENIQKRLLI